MNFYLWSRFRSRHPSWITIPILVPISCLVLYFVTHTWSQFQSPSLIVTWSSIPIPIRNLNLWLWSLPLILILNPTPILNLNPYRDPNLFPRISILLPILDLDLNPPQLLLDFRFQSLFLISILFPILDINPRLWSLFSIPMINRNQYLGSQVSIQTFIYNLDPEPESDLNN
jgi:hypothetical protein